MYSNYMVCLRMRLLMSQNLSRNLYKANNMGPSVSFPKNIGRLENNVYICTQKGSYGTSIYDNPHGRRAKGLFRRTLLSDGHECQQGNEQSCTVFRYNKKLPMEELTSDDAVRQRGIEAFNEIWAMAEAGELPDLTMDEINEEISLYRAGK